MIGFAPYLGPVRLAIHPALGAPYPDIPPAASPALKQTGDGSLTAGLAIPGILVLGSAAASAYHGYKRNKSTGWAIWWGFMGFIFPILTPVVAIAQGFGKRVR